MPTDIGKTKIVQDITMKELELDIGSRVIVRELKAHGYVYESARSDGSLDRIYGVSFDKTQWPKNFVATKVWHCKAVDLDPE